MKKNIQQIFGVMLTLVLGVATFTLATTDALADTGLDSAIKGLNTTAQSAQLIDSADSAVDAEADLNAIISRIIQVVLSITGTLFLILIFVAGQLWMNAGGNDDQVLKAKNIMTAAVVGLAITIGAYSIANFVIDRLLYVTLGS